MDIKEVFMRKIGKKSYLYIAKKYRKNKKIKGRVLNIPKEYIGSWCLLIPITESQKSYFYDRTVGNKRRVKYVEQVLKNPLKMIDKVS